PGVEQGAVIGSALVIDQKALQAEVEAAALTRTGFRHDHLLKDAEYEPQAAHLIAFDRQGLDATGHLAVPDELVPGLTNRDGIGFDTVARLGKGERGVLLGLPELGTAFG